MRIIIESADDLIKTNWAQVMRESNIKMPGFIAFIETYLISDALKTSDGNIAQAAKSLGLLRTTLSHKIKRYGLKDVK